MLDADLRDFFTTLDHCWLAKFLEHRIADERMLRLIRKWRKAGIIARTWSESGSGVRKGIGGIRDTRRMSDPATAT